MTRTTWSVVKVGLLALALSVMSLVAFTGGPASAHDQLVSSNPEDGAELDTQPEWLEMTFSGNLQEVGNEVRVEVGGKNVSAGELTVEGKRLSVALPDNLKPGEYSVIWRVVSSDGHPISGDYGFTLTDVGGAGGSAEHSTESGQPGLGGGVVDEPGKNVEERGEIGETAGADSGMSTPMIVLLGVGALAVIVIVILLMRRKSQGLPGTEGDADKK